MPSPQRQRRRNWLTIASVAAAIAAPTLGAAWSIIHFFIEIDELQINQVGDKAETDRIWLNINNDKTERDHEWSQTTSQINLLREQVQALRDQNDRVESQLCNAMNVIILQHLRARDEIAPLFQKIFGEPLPSENFNPHVGDCK